MRRSVLMLTTRYFPVFGGAAVQAGRLSSELQRRGWRVSVVTSRSGGAPIREQVDGIPVLRVPTWGAGRHGVLDLSFSLGCLLPLLWMSRRFAILHVHGLGTFTFFPLLLAKLLGMAVIVKMTLRGSDDARSVAGARFGILRDWSFRLADRVISISPPMSDDFRASGHDASKLWEMPQGVDVNRYCPATAEERRSLRDRLGLAREGPIIVFVGSVFHRKGADIAIDAFELLARRWPDLRLVIVGMDETTYDPVEMPEERSFAMAQKRKIADLGLADRVLFTGFVANAEQYLRCADIFLFPSRLEGFGTVMVEAMAVGLPCVVSDLDGISASVFDPGANGIIVEGEDPAAFAEAVAELLSAPDLCERMGRAARGRAEEIYAFERVGEHYEELYASALAPADPSRRGD